MAVAAARLIDVVVLPTPLFWLATRSFLTASSTLSFATGGAGHVPTPQGGRPLPAVGFCVCCSLVHKRRRRAAKGRESAGAPPRQCPRRRRWPSSGSSSATAWILRTV